MKASCFWEEEYHLSEILSQKNTKHPGSTNLTDLFYTFKPLSFS